MSDRNKEILTALSLLFEYVIQAIIDSVKANESIHYDFTRKNAGRKLDL